MANAPEASTSGASFWFTIFLCFAFLRPQVYNVRAVAHINDQHRVFISAVRFKRRWVVYFHTCHTRNEEIVAYVVWRSCQAVVDLQTWLKSVYVRDILPCTTCTKVSMEADL